MTARAIELPLFPLNVVLFPGVVLPLHIFEPRYRQMIADCEEQKTPFGVVLARPESQPLAEEPYLVGTMAEIRELDRLEDGRIILMAVGVQRFRILSQHREKPYLSALVELYEDVFEPMDDLDAEFKQAYNLFGTYIDLLLKAANEQERDMRNHLPNRAEELSHFIAYFLDLPNEQKQYFLELTSTMERLQEEITILRREVPLMRQMLMGSQNAERNMLN
ncbi:MAG TPA: ATP-dependent protease [Ktedonobacter sp.]|jgi:Lon protease-like protein|nr:ATP-dependent protease [Ktedonobacter sp.]HAG99652.1 ATP-dependent protease [Ktedonobacter sp.]HBE26259.1 ATP-dependent protease [Ktedonobacter sp.]HBE29306.1 ATP-dependent protease [Ktedonobacter sp.]HCF83632.1 ATP-dependent protease [Ktedonobacter sp.]